MLTNLRSQLSKCSHVFHQWQIELAVTLLIFFFTSGIFIPILLMCPTWISSTSKWEWTELNCAVDLVMCGTVVAVILFTPTYYSHGRTFLRFLTPFYICVKIHKSIQDILFIRKARPAFLIDKHEGLNRKLWKWI